MGDSATRLWYIRRSNPSSRRWLPAAMFEDYQLVSPEWRPRLLVASIQWLHGRNSADAPALLQVRDDLSTVGGSRAQQQPHRDEQDHPSSLQGDGIGTNPTAQPGEHNRNAAVSTDRVGEPRRVHKTGCG